MNDDQNTEKLGASQPQKTSKKPNGRMLFFVKEILAILVWIYIVTKLFIYDIDIFLIEKLSPSFIWIVNYKFFILIGILAIIFMVTRNRDILLWSLYVIFYPVILFLWRIPSLIYKTKSWNLIFALIDSIISFFKSFKLSYITTAFYLVSAALIFGISNKIILWISLVVLFGILLFTYIQRSIKVFKPSGMSQLYIKIFNSLGKFVRSIPPAPEYPAMILDEKELEIPIESMDEKQLQKWITGVQYLVFFNRICLFVAKKIKSYQESRFNIASAAFSILMLLIFTVLSFSIINFGLYKINPDFFEVSSVPTYFTFIYYSFSNIFHSSIREITATAPPSQVVLMTESLFEVFLIGIFVTLVITVRSQRETDEMNKVISYLNEEGRNAEGYLKEKYRYNIEEAIEALQKLNAFLANILNKMTETIK